MEKSVTFKVSDLRRLVAEESTKNEFKPKLGDGVESNNKTNAGKAYSDAKKRAKDYDGGGKEEYWKGDAEYKKEDYNGTPLDYNPENVDDSYKKRVHALAKGYNSEAEMNNKLEKTGDFSDNEKIYKEIERAGKERHKKVEDLKKSGLQASKMPAETFKKEEMYESVDGFNMRNMINQLKENSEKANPSNEEKKVKTVHFKKTQFLNEDYMRNRIPDEFKQEGCLFKMKDKADSTYLIEWKGGKANILEHNNKAGFDESFNRMKQLMGYKSDSNSTDKNLRLNEGNNFQNMCERVRNINEGFNNAN